MPEMVGERLCQPTHIIEARYPDSELLLDDVQYTFEGARLGDVSTDEANFPGGATTCLIDIHERAGNADVSWLLRIAAEQGRSVVATGPQTSITGAAVPRGDVVLNMSEFRKGQSEVMKTEHGYEITVQSGVTLEELNQNLSRHGLFFPAGPTEEHATVVGAICTNGAGARSYKYGKTNRYVEGLSVVLATGEELHVRRGQYKALPGDDESPGGYFILDLEEGRQCRVPVPQYRTRRDIKASTGYNAWDDIDLVDLIAGSEGTLGIITEATIRVLEEPPTTMALVPCESDQQAFDLIARLDSQEKEKRTTLEPGGISAVEVIGSDAANFVRANGVIIEEKSGDVIRMPDGAAFLLVQIEVGKADSLSLFAEHCEAAGVDLEAIAMATPDDTRVKDRFIAIREAVPRTVNTEIRKRKEQNAAVTKVGADPCVVPERIPEMMQIFQEEFSAAGVEYYWWGHGEGNIHYNALPSSEEELVQAKVAVLRAGVRVIKELGGVGTAEHGIGKNLIKQLLLLALHGETGLHEMITVKKAFDPDGILAPGNIYDLDAISSWMTTNEL